MWVAKEMYSKEYMPSAVPISEGFVPFRGFRTWYRVVGDLAQPEPAKFPYLCSMAVLENRTTTSNPLRSLPTLGAPSSSTISWGRQL
jgi:hypothetical protein